ncbi:hypothetical protein ILYODFUR_031282, partial [Ilyodon furcidens]
NPEHPLHETVLQQQSVFSQRLLQICCKTDSYRRSFLPTAIRIYNGSLKKPTVRVRKLINTDKCMNKPQMNQVSLTCKGELVLCQTVTSFSHRINPCTCLLFTTHILTSKKRESVQLILTEIKT